MPVEDDGLDEVRRSHGIRGEFRPQLPVCSPGGYLRLAWLSRCAEIAVVPVDHGIEVVQDFTTSDQFQAPVLTTVGMAQMEAAILRVVDLLESRTITCRANDVEYFLPWIFLLTDGELSDMVEHAARDSGPALLTLPRGPDECDRRMRSLRGGLCAKKLIARMRSHPPDWRRGSTGCRRQPGH